MMRIRNVMALFAVLALAVALCPGIAFAASGQHQAASLQGQDALPSDLSDGRYHIVLDGDDSNWVQYYLDGKDATFMPTAELYFEDTQVDAGLYDLKWQLNWYDEQAGKDRYEDTQLPLRMVNKTGAVGEYDGIGAQYEVRAVPATESMLEGQSQQATAMPVDKYTFEFHGKYAYVVGGYEAFVVPSWHTGFMVATGAGEGIAVRDDAVNSDCATIDPKYYDVTYYERKPAPDTWIEENPLDGFPTKQGTYFAVIKGKDPYFGSTIIDFDVIDGYEPANANVHIDKGDGRLFSDGELEVGIDADCSAGEEGVDWQLKIAVGMQGTYNDETRSFDPAFDKGEYTYDPTTKTITLDGGKIMDWADEGDWLPVIVRARIEDNVGTIRAEAVEFVEWRKARYDYFDRKWDQSMLPGWDDQVAASCNVYVENSEHPEGAELKYYVDDVKIVHQDSWEGDKEVVKLEKVADGWRYEACEYGEATLRVDYTDLGGEKQSYEFTVYVGEDVYEVDIVAEGGVERTHPGESVALTAVARHHNVDDDNASLEGVSYEWGIDDGSEFATVAPDANDPTKAVVTFKPLADEQDEIWESVCVFVRLYNGVDEEGEPDECAYRDRWFQLEQCAANEHEWETVSVTAATCETAGVKHLQCKNCGLERDVETPALGHEWGKPVYVWADDNSTVTATRTCTRATGASCTQTETVKTTAQTTAATYTAAGKTVYTATFENTAFETQTKTVEIAKLVQLDQPMKVSAAKATVKAKKLKKKAQTVAPIKVSAQKGTVSFKVESVKGKAKKVLKLDAKTGKITVKKGTKAGTYKMTVTVTASGNDQYKAGSQIVTATVKVK